MVPDPLIVFRASSSAVAVRGKCRPIRLLSWAAALYAPTIKLPRRTAYLSSEHAYAETPHGI